MILSNASFLVKAPSYHRPTLAKDFRLLQNEFSRPCLLVWRIAVLAQDTLDDDAQLGADVFANRPVDRHVLLNCLHQLTIDLNQCRLAEHFHRAFVDLQRVVKS